MKMSALPSPSKSPTAIWPDEIVFVTGPVLKLERVVIEENVDLCLRGAGREIGEIEIAIMIEVADNQS